MRFAALVTLIVVLGGGAARVPPEQPGCAVYAFTAATVADMRRGRLVLSARVDSPEEALKIAHGAALGMAELVDLDVVVVHVSRPQDAAALAVPGKAVPEAMAMASLRLAAAAPASGVDATIRLARGQDHSRGRRQGGLEQALDGAQVQARVAQDPLSAAARRSLCGIR